MVQGAARGPGNYHGTMSKAELEREAGGPVFSSSDSRTRQQVETTRYQPPGLAEGAEETRLFDTQGQLITKSADTQGSQQSSSSGSFSSSSSSSSSSLSSSSSGNSGSSDVVYGGWKLLDNGTYIRVYDNQYSRGSSSGGYQAGSGSSSGSGSGSFRQSSSSSSEQVRLEGDSGGVSRGGSLEMTEDLSSNSIDGDDNSGYMNTGWVLQPDGTYVRKQSSWSSSSRSSQSGGSGANSGRGSGYSGGSSYSSSSSSSSSASSFGSGSGSGNVNVVMGAARGPGDYHGTMSKSELEREAGGSVFGGGGSSETRQQVENTQYRGSTYNAGETYNSGSSLSDDDVVVTNGGRWVWSEVNNKWEWEAAGGSGGSGDARSSQTSDSGSDDSGWVQLANGTWTRQTSSWSSSAQSSVRYGEDGARGGVATGTVFSGEQVGSRVAAGQLVPAGQQGGQWGDEGNNSTGWVTRPDGTMVKKSSSWASWSSSSYDTEVPDNNLNHIQRQLEQRVKNNLNRQLPNNVEPGFEDEYRRNRRHKRAAR